jgi:nucleoid-associated protein YgaU
MHRHVHRHTRSGVLALLALLLVFSFAPAIPAAASQAVQQPEPATPATSATSALRPSASTSTSTPNSTAEPAAPAVMVESRPRMYLVRDAGHGRRPDTLSNIAERYLGDRSRWPEIFALNRGALASPDLLHPGAVLRLPPDAIGLPVAPATRTHVVGRGDSLWHIAGEQLGDPGRWPEIFALNRGTISSPDLLQPGWVLELPPDAPAAGVP